MTQGDIITVRVERLAAGGAGLATGAAGHKIFAELCAPGDLVRLRIREVKKSFARGDLLEVLEPSPLRAAPFCPLFGQCGGCSLQHMTYDAQLAAKERLLQDAFRRVGGLAPGSLPAIRVHPSPPREYRNRVQLHCHPRDRRVLGFRSRGEGALVPVADCPVAEGGIRRSLQAGGPPPPPEKDRFTVYSLRGVLLSEGGERRGRVSLGPPGEARGLTLDAGLFFQSNAVMLEALLGDLRALVREAAAEGPGPLSHLYDLYCGVGTFAAFLGDAFQELELLEHNKAALALARENLPPGAAGRAALAGLSDDSWVRSRRGRGGTGGKLPPGSLVVVDPPREGLSRLMAEFLAREGAGVLAYVSCDAATLARDAGLLLAGGWRIRRVELYDFYPQTAHIESLTVFTRPESPGP